MRLDTNEIDRDRAAIARSRAYLLLGRLFLRGVTTETLEYVEAVAPLDDLLSSFVPDGASEPNLDEAAAAHQETFGFNVFPFQSTFLEQSARAGGHETRRVTDAYRSGAFPVVQTAESPDHLGVELQYMGFLSKMEAEQDGPDADRARSLQVEFLDDHLLWWVPALAHVLRRHGEPFFAALGDLTLDTLVEHRTALGTDDPESSDGEREETPRGARTKSTELLEDPDTRLRDIAEHLLVPAKTGIFLSRAEIRRMSRREDLPAGFGSRGDMMGNLLRSAADYGGLDAVTDHLLEHVDGARGVWRTFGSELPDDAGPVADVWLETLDETETMLEELERAATAQSNR